MSALAGHTIIKAACLGCGKVRRVRAKAWIDGGAQYCRKCKAANKNIRLELR
jgi:hypothetical protein